MGRWKDKMDLLMAVSSLQESVIKATQTGKGVTKMKHRVRIVNATFQEGTSEILMYMRPRLIISDPTVTWRCLFILHLMLNEGDNQSVVRMLGGEISLLDQIALPFAHNAENENNNILAYCEYLKGRIRIAEERGNNDLGIPSANGPDYLEGDIKTLVEDNTIDQIFQLTILLSAFKFFRDDFDNGSVLEASKLLFNDFLFCYCNLTKLILNLLKSCQPVDEQVYSSLVVIVNRYGEIHGKLEKFLEIMKKIECYLPQKVPLLLPPPKLPSLPNCK